MTLSFIGFEEEFKEYKKEEKTQNIIGTGNKISYDDMPDISEEDLKIVMESRFRKDPYTVYMQSDMGFYDNFYHEKDIIEDGIDPELMEEVKNVRRIYKNYFQYNYAMKIIDEYLDALEEKYGGPHLFQYYLNAGLVHDYIPPKPVYSRTSADYQQFLEGKFNLNINDWDDDKIEELMSLLIEELLEKVSIDDIRIKADVLTDPVAMSQSGIRPESTSGIYRMNNNSIFGEVNSNDLLELQRILRSWMDPESELTKDIETKNTNYFSETEQAIRERYFTQSPITATGLSEAIEKGYMEEDEEDLDEMVIDPVSSRPMTRAELRNRQFVRFMAEAGWNELRLMRKLGVGSNFELKLLEQKKSRRKNANKKAKSFIDDIIGYDAIEIDSIDALNDVLFDD